MADLTSQFHAEFIKQIGLGINISRTYPKGHPSLMPIIQKVKIMLKEVPMEKESLSLVIIEDVIMIALNPSGCRSLKAWWTGSGSSMSKA
jgi:hypothetical protein